MTKDEIKSKLAVLGIQYQNEMRRQNQKSSLDRSYREADRILREINSLRALLSN